MHLPRSPAAMSSFLRYHATPGLGSRPIRYRRNHIGQTPVSHQDFLRANPLCLRIFHETIRRRQNEYLEHRMRRGREFSRCLRKLSRPLPTVIRTRIHPRRITLVKPQSPLSEMRSAPSACSESAASTGTTKIRLISGPLQALESNKAVQHTRFALASPQPTI